MIALSTTITILLVLLLTVQYCVFGIDLSFAESLTGALIGSTIMLIPTLFVLDKLIKRHEVMMLKKIEKERYKNNLNTRHSALVSNLEKRYIHYVTKIPAQTDKTLKIKKEDFEKIVNNLEDYIDRDFLKTNYKVLFNIGYGPFDFRETEMSYQDFSEKIFRDEIYEWFNEYVSRYAVFIPEDIFKCIFKIEDTLKDVLFSFPKDINLIKVEFDPKDIIDPVRVIGNEIIKMRKYLEEE